MFKNALKLYVYPSLDDPTGSIITADNLRVAPNLRHLHAYLIENHLIQAIHGYDRNLLSIHSPQVVEKIQSGDASWESMVQPTVAGIIKERRLFGYKG
jgi:hypothetical protein